jgi:hypothetical protein
MRFVVILRGAQWVKGRKRSTVQEVALYVSSVSWSDKGYTAKKIAYTPDRHKAATFAKIAAEELAKDLSSPRWNKRASVLPEKET